ncbi:general substrate transporter [Xylaria curta]|nr:general substrate transporter [Xylaria curta]
MMNGLQSLDMWKASFNYPGPAELGLYGTNPLLSLPFCAGYCDRFGQYSAMFIAARGLLGFGLSLNITAAPLLIIELAYPSHAAPLVSIYNSLWGLGSLSAAWITYGSFHIGNDGAWRIPSLLQGTSNAIQLGLCFVIDESPRWLVSVDGTEEARDLLVKYHANGNPNDPLHATSYLSFFQTPANCRRFFIILAVGFFSQWSGNGLVSYYLTLVLDSIGYKSQDTQTFINALMTVWGLIVGIAFSLVVNRFRRLTLFLISTAGCLVSYGIWTGLEAVYENSLDADGNGGNAAAAWGVLAIILIFGFFYAIGWGTLQVTYPLEILPFGLRARGLVLYNLFCALALIFNLYVNPILIEFIVIYFLFVETGGKPNIEQVAKILDGEDHLGRATQVIGVTKWQETRGRLLGTIGQTF